MELHKAAISAGIAQVGGYIKIFHLHQSSALTFPRSDLGWLASMAERVGFNKQ